MFQAPTKLISTLTGAGLAVVAATAAFACGPFFPATVLDKGDPGLLRPPVTAFRSILDSLAPPPSEFKAVPSPRIPYHNPDFAALTLSGELADLRAAGATEAVVARHLQRRQLPDDPKDYREPDPMTDLPREFSLYFTGAVALRKDNLNAARDAFAGVLALPAAERRYKTVWAAYMLGKVAFRSGDKNQAADWFARTREFARTGFVDSTGLAAASIGDEARIAFDRKDWFQACELYLRQYATGDTTALNSLRFTAAGAVGDPNSDVFARFAKEPGPRAVLTARLLERYGNPMAGNLDESYPFAYDDEGTDTEKPLRRWLAALEKENTGSREAGLFALAAYQAGAFNDCARWLKLAPADQAGPNWLRAKLALRDGRIDEATALLASLVCQTAAPFDAPANVPQLQGELAQLRLARRDYADALRLLLHGHYWEDAAYVAERVLSIDELVHFIATEPDLGEDAPRIKHLLARRLMRAGREIEADAYLPKEYAAVLAEFTAHLKAGGDLSRPAAVRGLSLARAAEILRKSGMELQGTELAPDFAINEGSYQGYSSVLNTRSKAGGIAKPSDDEITRALAVQVTPNRRYHYRYQAADLAWQAALLLPDNSTELAELLTEAGGWLKARDPLAAERFYKALVNRCPDTDAGREAKRAHWFPKTY